MPACAWRAYTGGYNKFYVLMVESFVKFHIRKKAKPSTIFLLLIYFYIIVAVFNIGIKKFTV